MTAQEHPSTVPIATILRAAGLVTATLALLDLLGRQIPWLSANQLGVFAAVFLLAPGLFGDEVPGPAAGLPRPEARRVHLRHVAAGIAVSLVVLAGFVPGFGAWMTVVNDWTFAPSTHSLGRPADRYVGQPAVSEAPLTIFSVDDRIVIAFDPPTAPWSIAISGDGPFVPLRRPAAPTTEWTAHGDAPRTVAVTLVPRGVHTLRVAASLAGTPLEPAQIAVGAAGRAPPADELGPDGLSIAINHRWMLVAIFVQLLLIALPEEVFFRGFLQARLDQHARLGRRWRLPLGLHLSPAIVATSAIFAVVHFVVGFAPARLAVFFPSLLFGWLRDRTGGIVAPDRKSVV